MLPRDTELATPRERPFDVTAGDTGSVLNSELARAPARSPCLHAAIVLRMARGSRLKTDIKVRISSQWGNQNSKPATFGCHGVPFLRYAFVALTRLPAKARECKLVSAETW
jgi:hypothetical protein